MVDVQNRGDERGIAIDKVGVTDLHYPIIVRGQNNKCQQTVAKLSMSVNLAHDIKGTHMSRFIEILNENRCELSVHTLPRMLRDLKSRLDADRAHVEVDPSSFFNGASFDIKSTEAQHYRRYLLQRRTELKREGKVNHASVT